jgi:dTDP-4-dehydrorhamnose reductase
MHKDSSLFSNVLITGADGMVGSYVDFGIKLGRKDLDVTQLEEVKKVFTAKKPRVIIHLAALTDLDRCEKNPDEAYRINSVGTYNVALVARDIGAKVIYVSTAGIFDGIKKGPYTEEDAGNPQNNYGHSKYLGECAVTNLLENYVIARVCWMFGGGPEKDKKFVAKIIQQLGNKEIFALDDSFGSPTYGKDLVKALKELILEDTRGIVHLGGKGKGSRYDVACHIVKTLKAPITVTPVNSDYFKLPAKRVANEEMTSKKNLMRPWQEALKEYLETEWIPYLTKKNII